MSGLETSPACAACSTSCPLPAPTRRLFVAFGRRTPSCARSSPNLRICSTDIYQSATAYNTHIIAHRLARHLSAGRLCTRSPPTRHAHDRHRCARQVGGKRDPQPELHRKLKQRRHVPPLRLPGGAALSLGSAHTPSRSAGTAQSVPSPQTPVPATTLPPSSHAEGEGRSMAASATSAPPAAAAESRGVARMAPPGIPKGQGALHRPHVSPAAQHTALHARAHGARPHTAAPLTRARPVPPPAVRRSRGLQHTGAGGELRRLTRRLGGGGRERLESGFPHTTVWLSASGFPHSTG